MASTTRSSSQGRGADGGPKPASSTEAPLRIRVSKGREARNKPGTNQVISKIKSATRRASAGGRKAGASTHHAGRGAGVRQTVGSRQQRVTVKARVQPSPRSGGAAAMQRHVAYIERHGVAKDGGPAVPISADEELTKEQTAAFAERAAEDRHSFRFIVSPERGGDMDLDGYTRDLMQQMEQDLGTKLDWMAVPHYDTDNPHVHILVRGVDDKGGDLVISRDYISNGMRERARELATRELGYRTDLDVYRAAAKEVGQERWTGLDAAMQREQERRPSGLIEAGRVPSEPFAKAQRELKLRRLAFLRDHGLATEYEGGRWAIHEGADKSLRAMGQERRVAAALKPHMDAERSVKGALQSKDTLGAAPVQGIVLDRGLADQLSGTEYVVVGGFDGKVHYTSLSLHSERHMDSRARVGDTVTLRTHVPPAATSADKNVLRRLEDGVYNPAKHVEEVRQWKRERIPGGVTPERYVESHVRRMDALASRGHVERLPDGTYRVPADLPERLKGDPSLGRDKASFVRLDVDGRGPMRRQSQLLARVFLDDELQAGKLESLRASTTRTRSQAAFLEALEARADKLVELRMAERTPRGIRLVAGFSEAMRAKELGEAAARLSGKYGQPVDLDAARRFQGKVAAIEQLPSGPHAVVVSGQSFAVVPAKDGLQRQLGKEVALQLPRGESMKQSFQAIRIRYAAMDMLDKGKVLGLGRS